MSIARLVIIVGALLLLCGLVLSLEPTSAAGVTAIDATQEATQPQPTGTAAVTPTPVNTIPLPPTVSGVVTDAQGPVAGAIVQIQGTPHTTKTDENGAYSFSGISGTTPIVLTAWSTGHYLGWTDVNPSAPDWTGGTGIKISLNLLPTTDNSKYKGFSTEGVSGSASCGLCHREYKEWLSDTHAQAASDIHFVTMYTGTDVNGNPGQQAQFGADGTLLPPDPSQPYYGPGFRTDTPNRAGNCATCHAPMASTSPNNQNCSWSGCHTSLTVEQSNGIIPLPAIPISLHGDAAEGVTCDFCHKIGDVLLDPKTNLPYPDMPGILSLRMYRPVDDSQQVFFGTLIDVARPDSYLPLLSQSQYCAGCHYGVFGGVVGMGDVKDGTLIYDSYGEWLASPYSDPKTGTTCQQCHMPISSANWAVTADRGGITRDYVPMFNHTMLGGTDEKLLQHAVTMKSSAQRTGGQLQVQVSITNDNTGHDVPTDDPSRSMILVVQASGADGKPLTLNQGPVNPDYSGNFGGLPGKTFAKVLKDNYTGETPTAAIWRPLTIVEDTRLVALATDTTRYSFNVPAGTAATVNVRLVYRRAFAKLAKEKGWNDPDIMMAHETIQVAAN